MGFFKIRVLFWIGCWWHLVPVLLGRELSERPNKNNLLSSALVHRASDRCLCLFECICFYLIYFLSIPLTTDGTRGMHRFEKTWTQSLIWSVLLLSHFLTVPTVSCGSNERRANVCMLLLFILIICCESFKTLFQKRSVEFVSMETPMGYLHLDNVFVFGHLTVRFGMERKS